MILAVAGGVAVQLEVASIGGQLRAERANMTGGAGLAGLNCKRWNGERRGPCREGEKDHQQQDRQRLCACLPRHGPAQQVQKHVPHLEPGISSDQQIRMWLTIREIIPSGSPGARAMSFSGSASRYTG